MLAEATRQATWRRLQLERAIERIERGETDLKDPDAANAVLRQFLAQAPASAAPAPSVADAARQALDLALIEPATRDLAIDLVEEPPQDDQMGVEMMPEFVVLGLFILPFLQSKFNVRISRTGGKTDVDVQVGKDALSPSSMDKVVSIAQAVLAGGGARQ